jgi:ABC-type Fe3+-hydroxamate transport system substrate-binding protein
MKMSAALGVALALLAGCGSSSGDSNEKDAETANTATATATATANLDAPAGDTMSAAAWSRRVEAICVKSAARASRAGKRLGRRSAAAGDSKRELTYKVLTFTSKGLDPWLDRVEALAKPEGREQDANQFIANMRNVGDLLGKTATAIKQNDEASGKKLVKQLQAKTVSVRSQAQALGIEKCNPPSA